ncbi:MAG: DUF1501 domain-containing protein [Phycisphaerales bacterium]
MPLFNRREFVTSTLGGATLLATGISVPGFLNRTARASAPERDRRILVLVQLSGGNDGLNTVVPYADDRYHRARPTLRIAENAVLKLDESLGLNPDMVGFKRLYDEGRLGVAMNVGYPNPDRSHFRSMDIWHTASLAPERVETGWLGRVVDSMECPEDAAPAALHLDSTALPLALRSNQQPTPSIRSLDAFRLQGAADEIESIAGAARDAAHDDLLFVQRVALSSCRNARRIERIAEGDGAEFGGSYPGTGLGRRLNQIAALIKSEFGARVYYTSLGGFDTHSGQGLSHGRLLRELSDAVTAFSDDLTASGLGDRVTLMTFSEFGRRVGENSSRGTDHGAAAPLFLVGGAVNAGVHGHAPDLGDLAEGDVRHDIDFRSIYAAMLDDWLGVNSRAILGDRFDPAPDLLKV